MKTLKAMLFLALIVVAAWKWYDTNYFKRVCDSIGGYYFHLYVPPYTCVYIENPPNDWQVVTWLYAWPVR